MFFYFFCIIFRVCIICCCASKCYLKFHKKIMCVWTSFSISTSSAWCSSFLLVFLYLNMFHMFSSLCIYHKYKDHTFIITFYKHSYIFFFAYHVCVCLCVSTLWCLSCRRCCFHPLKQLNKYPPKYVQI